MNGEELQFVDTNVIVYAHDLSAGEKHTRAKTLLSTLWQTQNGCISVQVLQEFYVTVTQKIKSPLSQAQASEIITLLSVWRVHSPIAQEVLSAIQLQKDHQLSFWDAMILQSAAHLGCKTLWSEDLSPRVYGDVQVINPFLEAKNLGVGQKE